MAMPRGKIYTKEYFNMGQLKVGGWLNDNAKTDYWFFYYKNEGKKEEGFYTVNQRNKYWKFYKVDGKKQMEGRFRSDSAYGWWVFYGNDKVEKKVEYCEGKKMGTPVIIPTAIFQKWRNIRMVLKQENGQIMQHLKETISV